MLSSGLYFRGSPTKADNSKAGGGGAAEAAGPAAMAAWPARTTQLFDGVYMSSGHVHACLEAETTVVDPLQGWRARKWSNALLDKCKGALRGGRLLDASKAVLLRHLLVGEMEGREEEEVLALVPTYARKGSNLIGI